MTDSGKLHYDAILILSFGGPEEEDEVVPFLQNVTRGRGIPVERLEEVGEHYYRFGGRSPINEQNIEMIENLRAELRRRHIELPVYYGTRNWHPFAEDTAEHMARAGVRRCLVLATSAWGGYSGALQYDEDIIRVREHLAAKDLPDIEFTKLRQFFNHPLFIEEFAAAIAEAQAALAQDGHPQSRLIFTAHSVPLSKREDPAVPSESEEYEAQVQEASRLVAERLQAQSYDLVWQSRSGAPHIPWLEPDVVDFVEAEADAGRIASTVICPIGFLTDHMEVIWDLDTELADACEQRGIAMFRARTPGNSPRFASLVANLVEEAQGTRELESLGELPAWGASVNGVLTDSYHY